MPTKFIAEYKPRETRPNEPILIGRNYSQTRVTIKDAKDLIDELRRAVFIAELEVTKTGVNL